MDCQAVQISAHTKTFIEYAQPTPYSCTNVPCWGVEVLTSRHWQCNTVGLRNILISVLQLLDSALCCCKPCKYTQLLRSKPSYFKLNTVVRENGREIDSLDREKDNCGIVSEKATAVFFVFTKCKTICTLHIIPADKTNGIFMLWEIIMHQVGSQFFTGNKYAGRHHSKRHALWEECKRTPSEARRRSRAVGPPGVYALWEWMQHTPSEPRRMPPGVYALWEECSASRQSRAVGLPASPRWHISIYVWCLSLFVMGCIFLPFNGSRCFLRKRGGCRAVPTVSERVMNQPRVVRLVLFFFRFGISLYCTAWCWCSDLHFNKYLL